MQLVQRSSLCAAVLVAAGLLGACNSPSQAQTQESKQGSLVMNPQSLNGQLLDAARTGDAVKVRDLLAQGAGEILQALY